MAKQQPKKPAPKEREYEISDELKELGEKIIGEKRIDIGASRIGYVFVSPNISKFLAGRCTRATKLLNFFSKFDYVVEISQDLWEKLDEKSRYVLLYHEIMHILPIMNEKTGKWDFRIRKHDVEDFSKIIKEYGTDWMKTVKTTISSIYDLDPAQEDSIIIG